MLTRPTALILVFWLVLPQASQAANLDWLYDVELPVVSQDESERIEAMRDGLSIVLHRVSGLRSLPKLEELEAAFDNVEQFQLQFRYEEDPEGIFDTSTQRLIVSFDPNAIQSLIRSLGLPIWSAQRPRLLFVVSIEGAARRDILGSTTRHVLQRVIASEALRRGIEYDQPLMDLNDREMLHEGSIAFGFFNSHEMLRSRYGVDLVIVARVDRREFGQHRVWLRTYSNTLRNLQIFDVDELLDVGKEIVNRTADNLANQYAVAGITEGALVLVVRDVTSLEGYKNLIDYLEKWEFIDVVMLRSVDHDRFEFWLMTASSWDQFLVHLEAEQLLVPVNPLESSESGVQEFTWLGAK